MPDTFVATIDDFIADAPRAVERLRKQSVQEVAIIANTPRGASRLGRPGKLPVDTSTLRNSISGFTDGVLSADEGDKAVVLAIAGARPQEKAGFAYTAPYALYVEVGARGVPAAAFVRGAAMEWPRIVAKNARRLSRGT